MAWVKGDRIWHFVEMTDTTKLPRKYGTTCNENIVSAPPVNAPTDADPKCPTCDAAHP